MPVTLKRSTEQGYFYIEFLTMGGRQYRHSVRVAEDKITFCIFAKSSDQGWGPLFKPGMYEYRSLEEAMTAWKTFKKSIYPLRLMATIEKAEPCIIERNRG